MEFVSEMIKTFVHVTDVGSEPSKPLLWLWFVHSG